MNLMHVQQPLRDVLVDLRLGPVTHAHLVEQLAQARLRLEEVCPDAARRTELDIELRAIATHIGMARKLLGDPAMPQPSQRGLELLTFATNLLDDMIVRQHIKENP